MSKNVIYNTEYLVKSFGFFVGGWILLVALKTQDNGQHYDMDSLPTIYLNAFVDVCCPLLQSKNNARHGCVIHII